jgi:hypothetical protein
MQAVSDEQLMERLEKKVDAGFAEMRAEFSQVRSESRADFRTLLSVIFGLWATTALAVVGILLGHA